MALSLRNLITTLATLGVTNQPPEMLLTLLKALNSPQDTLFGYEESWHYYLGDIYDWIWKRNETAASRRKAKLYRNVAPYFNPVTEIVDVDADKVFAPRVRGINFGDNALDARLNSIWTRSKFEQLLYQYVQVGAALGKVYLHVLDGKLSSIKVRRPDEMTVYKNPQTSEIVLARYSYMVDDPLGLELDPRQPGEPVYRRDAYSYDFVMTKDWYATFKDGKPWAYSSNPIGDDGLPLKVWENVLGIVPVVEVLHQEDGDGDGIAAWHTIKGTIDAANTIATFMAETVKMHMDPLIVVKGVRKTDVEKTLVDGKTNVWYLPLPQNPGDPEASLQLIEWTGNAHQVTEFIDWVKGRLVDHIPELQLARIQEQTNPSGLSVALQSSRLVGHINRLRPLYVKGLVDADRLAFYAEDVHNNDPLPDWDSLKFSHPLEDDAAYKHWVECGPILPRDETRDFANGLSLLQAGLIPRLEMLTRFAGYSLPDAEKLIKDADKEQEKLAPKPAPENPLGVNNVLPNGADAKNPAQTEGAFKAQNGASDGRRTA